MNRLVFSADFNSVLEATEYGMLLNGFMREWMQGAVSAVELHALTNADGAFGFGCTFATCCNYGTRDNDADGMTVAVWSTRFERTFRSRSIERVA